MMDLDGWLNKTGHDRILATGRQPVSKPLWLSS